MVGFLLIFTNIRLVAAQVMQSGSYQINSDSINFGGGLSSSGSYIMEDTLGEIATGESDSASFSIKAGYQQMQEVYLSMTAAADVVMDDTIGGITGGNANGSTSVTVTTDSRAGYQLSIQASQNPAMNSGTNSINDYDDGGAADFNFDTGLTDSHLGYSPEGSHIVSYFKDNGAVCGGAGTEDANDACWSGLTTSPVVIAQSGIANHPSGTETVIEFQVGIGADVNQPAGTYTATTTLTLLSL